MKFAFACPTVLNSRRSPAARASPVASEFTQRCLLSARYRDTEVSVEELPVEIVEAIAAKMESADPQADVELQPECAQCGHRWQTAFDIESFFWNEIQAWAARTMREVHTLARAYGWREADILNMSPQRRRFYLEMLAREHLSKHLVPSS